jgi:hypothetical protein
MTAEITALKCPSLSATAILIVSPETEVPTLLLSPLSTSERQGRFQTNCRNIQREGGGSCAKCFKAPAG